MNNEDQPTTTEPTPTNPPVTPTAPVMDIQPPKPVSRQPEPTAQTDQASPVVSDENATTDDAPTVSDQPQIVAAPEAPVDSSETSNVEANPEPAGDNVMAITPRPQKHRRPLGAVIVALVVGVLLIAVAIVVYFKTQDAGAPGLTDNADSSQEGSQTTTPLASSDIDQTTQQIDEALSGLDEAADFDTTSLDDDTLGL